MLLKSLSINFRESATCSLLEFMHRSSPPRFGIVHISRQKSEIGQVIAATERPVVSLFPDFTTIGIKDSIF